VAKARRLLGYEPRYPLEKGFVRYIDWYKGLAHRMPEVFAPAKR
jgi:nucleoside-diphosphate-sugar epimerase